MQDSAVSFKQLAATSKHFARRFLTIGENRLELLTIEVQEERDRLVRVLLLALGAAALGLLAGIALTAAIVVWLWAYSPVATLSVLTGLYGATAFGLYWRLTVLLREGQPFSATLDQVRKDRACLKDILS